MAIIDLAFGRQQVLSIEDYGQVIGAILNLKIPFTIVQYSLTESGIILRINVPDEKLKEVLGVLKQNDIEIRNSTVTVNEDLCVHCGHCISLCNTGALYYLDDCKRGFDSSKCVGCKICLDACPRKAISYD